jgi:AraC family transcriptional regulator
MAVTFSPAGFVLHEKERSYEGGGAGWLSIKSFRGGRALYEIGQRRYAVDDARYLVLNHQQAYTIKIDARQPVESFCVFFAPGLAESARQSLTLPDDRLLDLPEAPAPLLFFEKTYPHDDRLTPVLQHLRASHHNSTGSVEEQLHGLMGELLQAHFNVYREVERLPAARPATREELYRRVQVARDYAAALYPTPVSLDAMANAACLSPNHLLRTFKQVFGQTPHTYITRLRLDEAQRRLRHTDEPVTAICFAVGFASPGSFSWLFRRQTGLSPAQYRRQFR